MILRATHTSTFKEEQAIDAVLINDVKEKA